MEDLIFDRKAFDPHWTEIEFGTGGSRDALGIETLSEAILADLLPGVNNQTRRARYYSFWAWVLRDFINDPDTNHTQSGFYHWLHRRENALILAYLSHGCGGGAAGTEQGNIFWKDGVDSNFPLEWKSLLSVDGGGYELYFRGALEETNIIVRTENSPHDNLSNTVGMSLANAFEKAIAGTEYIAHYLDSNQLPKEIIEQYAEKACLCRVADYEEERSRLIEMLFRFDTPDLNAVKRLGSLCFFLDVIDQSNEYPLPQETFRSVLYFWSFGSHYLYQPQGNLIPPAEGWRIFQLRQYYVYAIESFWTLFLLHINNRVISIDGYINWLIEQLDLKALAEEFNLALNETDANRLTLKSFFEGVFDAISPEAIFNGIQAQQTNLNESYLSHAISQSRKYPDAQILAGNALLLLALIFWRCERWTKNKSWAYVSGKFAQGRLPIDVFLHHVEEAFQKEWTLSEWLRWFHQYYLWLQHRKVTLEKLVGRSQETARFEIVEIYSPDERSEVHTMKDAFVRGLQIDEPKMNAPRFPSAISLLSDLDIIESVGPNSYLLCPDGKEILQRYRDYAVPHENGVVTDEIT